MTETETVRLNKYLSAHGVCSRREADELDRPEEKVRVDGRIRLPWSEKRSPAGEDICV